MKFNTALKFLVASEALRVMYIRFGVRAQSVVVDRTSDTNNVADAALDVLLKTPVDSGGRFVPTGINNLRVVVDPVTRGDDGSSSTTGTMHHTVASDVLLEILPFPVNRGDGSSSKTGTTYHTVADAAVSDVLLETPVDSGGRFFPTGINNLRVVDSVTRGDGSSSKTGTMHHTVADAAVSDVLLETPADSGGRFFPTGISNRRIVIYPVTRSKTGTMHHTVAYAKESDVLLKTLPVDSGGRFSPSDINNNLHHAVVDPVTRGDGSSSKTSTMHHTVVDTGVSDVLLENDSGGSLVPPSGIVNHHAVVDAINDDGEISAFTGRKLIKSSKKVIHPKALCTLSLFADSLFMYANKCFTDIMVTISPCDNKDDTCYISERLPSLPQEEQEEQENQEEEQCFVGGSFPAKQNIRYNSSTGDCEFLYVDLLDDPCNSYIGDTGTGSLGLKARINVKNNPDLMFIQFTNDKGLTFYNDDNERVAKKRSSTHNDDRYLRQEGETRPALSMMPHPFLSRRLFIYPEVSIRNDTPYKANFARIDYCSPLCSSDENNFIDSGGTWTADDYRGGCLVTEIHSTLIIDGRAHQCQIYASSGTSYSKFYIMFIDGGCCLRSSEQSNTECPELDIDYCDPSVDLYSGYNHGDELGCKDMDCAHPMWADGCEACMCFNNGNAAWCDGSRSTFYDKYFEEHGENPWGDTNVRNRKCNPAVWSNWVHKDRHGNTLTVKQAQQGCTFNWNCAKGYECYKWTSDNRWCRFNTSVGEPTDFGFSF